MKHRKSLLPLWGRFAPAQRSAALLLLLAALLELFAWASTSFRGYDSYCHIFWIAEWHTLWQAGIVYPRWLPDSFAGFGAPSFYFYPPLTFFLSSALYAVLPQLSAAAIGKLLGILAFAGSGISMWLYLRWRMKGRGGKYIVGIPLLGAVLYMFAPYHFFDYSVRGAISEHLALVFVPMLFWGLDLVSERRRLRDARRGGAICTLALALLILTNLPSATAAGLGALVYVLGGRTAKFAGVAQLILFAGVAALLTAFYLVPIATLFREVQFNRLWVPASVLFSTPFLAILSGEALTINSYAFLSVLGGCVLLAGYWRNRDREPRPTENSLALPWMAGTVLLLQLPFVSWFLFNFIPPFTVIQLASRLSVLLILIAALAWSDELAANREVPVAEEQKRIHFASLVVLLWATGTIGLVSLESAHVHVHKTAPLPVGEAPEYATKWSRPYYDFGASLSAPFPSDTTWAIWQGAAAATLTERREPYSDTIAYQASAACHILLRRSYWPTWRATLDGNPIVTAPDSLGRLILEAPAGTHRIVTKLDSEPSATVGAYISAGAVVVVAMLWAFL